MSALKIVAATLLLLLASIGGVLPAFGDEFGDLTAQMSRAAKKRDLTKISDLTPVLQARRTSAGFQNLSLLSLDLLSEARVSCSEGGETCRFLIKHAQLLSPTDPVVSMEIFQIAETFGWKERWGFFWHALKNAGASPTLYAQGIALFGLFFLSFLTFLFGIRCLLQVARLEFRGVFRRRFGQFLLPVLGFAGLPLGILPTLFCWSLLLALARSERRTMVYFCTLTLPWVLLLPICETVFRNVSRGTERQIELVLGGVNAPAAWKVERPRGAFEEIAVGSSLYNAGDYAAAKIHFETAISTAREDRLLRAAYVRHAATELKLRDFAAAELSLQQAIAFGGESFEILQNLTLVAMGRADLEAQRGYLARLRQLDPKRFNGESLELAVLTEPLPFGIFWDRYLLPPESFGDIFHSSRAYLTHLGVIEPLVRLGGAAGLAAMMALGVLSMAIPMRRFA